MTASVRVQLHCFSNLSRIANASGDVAAWPISLCAVSPIPRSFACRRNVSHEIRRFVRDALCLTLIDLMQAGHSLDFAL